MRLLFCLGSRGEWGYIKPIIDEAVDRGHEAQIVATNMAVLPRYGDLANVIQGQGYQVAHRIFSSLEGDLHATMAKSVFAAGTGFVDALSQSRPDWLILAGDRAEQLGAAIAGSFTYTPTAHVQAGEVSGNIDDTTRHAIARLTHLHFASNLDAATRLRNSGEQEHRIHLVGAPQLDGLHRVAADGEGFLDTLGLNDSAFALAVFHPVTESSGSMASELNEMIAALDLTGMKCVWILPNNDAGGQEVREIVENQSRINKSIFVNLDRGKFLALLKAATLIIGNSSAGLLEAPTFGIPAVNIGRRQHGRVRGANVIDVEPHRNDIGEAIQEAISPAFKSLCCSADNPYGDGDSSRKIVMTLEQTKRDERLLVKRLTY